MVFNNFADPVNDLIEKHLKKQKMLSSNFGVDASNTPTQPYYTPENLPTSPMTIIRNNGVVESIVYGNVEALNDTEADPIIWRQTFARQNGLVTQIITTYPDGTQSTSDIIRDSGKVVSVT